MNYHLNFIDEADLKEVKQFAQLSKLQNWDTIAWLLILSQFFLLNYDVYLLYMSILFVIM